MKTFFEMDKYVETDVDGFQTADAEMEEAFRLDGTEVTADEQSE